MRIPITNLFDIDGDIFTAKKKVRISAITYQEGIKFDSRIAFGGIIIEDINKCDVEVEERDESFGEEKSDINLVIKGIYPV